MAEQENETYEYEAKPDIDFLKHDYERCRNNLSHYIDLAEDAREIRRNVWAGKTKSSRKESEDSFPFSRSIRFGGKFSYSARGWRYRIT